MNQHSILFLTIVVLLCTVPALSQDPKFPEKITTLYDKQTDISAVSIQPMRLNGFFVSDSEGELSLLAFFTYRGNTLVKPESIGLLFRSVNRPLNRWELSQNQNMEITADADHWKIPEVEIVGSGRSRNTIVESLGVSIPCEIFGKIANAKKVKLRLGDRGFELTKQHLTNLRSLANHAGCKPN